MEAMQFNKHSMPHRAARSALSKLISLRLTPDEYQQVKSDAAQLSLSEYIRRRLFSNKSENVRQFVDQNETRLSPQMRQKILAQILIRLGQSEMSSEICQTLKAIRTGLVDASPELTATLNRLHDELQTLRHDLLKALGLRP